MPLYPVCRLGALACQHTSTPSTSARTCAPALNPPATPGPCRGTSCTPPAGGEDEGDGDPTDPSTLATRLWEIGQLPYAELQVRVYTCVCMHACVPVLLTRLIG